MAPPTCGQQDRDVCPICYETEMRPDRWSCRSCRQGFCSLCLSRWMRRNSSCPLCRFELQATDFLAPWCPSDTAPPPQQLQVALISSQPATSTLLCAVEWLHSQRSTLDDLPLAEDRLHPLVIKYTSVVQSVQEACDTYLALAESSPRRQMFTRRIPYIISCIIAFCEELESQGGSR